MDDREKARELVERAWMQESYEAQESLMREAYRLDPANTDAIVWRAGEIAWEYLEGGLELLRDAVNIAARRLGPEPFLYQRGRLWDLPEARPYVRAKSVLARVLNSAVLDPSGPRELEECIELDTRDPLGVRYDLLRCYLWHQKPAEARGLMARFPEDRSMYFPWARLLACLQSPEETPPIELLRQAMEAAPGVAEWLDSRRDPEFDIPLRYHPGCRHEEGVVGLELAMAWRKTPGAFGWLRDHV